MKVLMISGDKYLLDVSSSAYKRLLLQRSKVEQLDVFVWPQKHSYSELVKAARANRYDVVTTQDPFWRGLLGWWIARRTGARLNVQVHTDLSAQPFMRRVLADVVLRRADSVRVVSEKIKKQVEQNETRATMYVLPIFVDVERFNKCERKPHDGKIILWAGRFEDEKNPLSAISVLEQVRADGIDARLIMLGSGSLSEKLQNRASGLPVEFPGWKDSRPYMEMADVVLVTSQHESWGANIVEALAARVPVVAPDVGIAKDAGAIVVPREKLAEAVISELKNPTRGTFQLKLLSAGAWSSAWRESL